MRPARRDSAVLDIGARAVPAGRRARRSCGPLLAGERDTEDDGEHTDKQTTRREVVISSRV
jgi:hypothetical protein